MKCDLYHTDVEVEEIIDGATLMMTYQHAHQYIQHKIVILSVIKTYGPYVHALVASDGAALVQEIFIKAGRS